MQVADFLGCKDIGEKVVEWLQGALNAVLQQKTGTEGSNESVAIAA